MKSHPILSPGDALLIVDVQNDFLPGGALAVPRGNRVIPALNRYLERFKSKGLPIYATRDWHPPNHCSFKGQGGRWPAHCQVFLLADAISAIDARPGDGERACEQMRPQGAIPLVLEDPRS